MPSVSSVESVALRLKPVWSVHADEGCFWSESLLCLDAPDLLGRKSTHAWQDQIEPHQIYRFSLEDLQTLAPPPGQLSALIEPPCASAIKRQR